MGFIPIIAGAIAAIVGAWILYVRPAMRARREGELSTKPPTENE